MYLAPGRFEVAVSKGMPRKATSRSPSNFGGSTIGTRINEAIPLLSSSQHVLTNIPNTNLLIFHQYFVVEKENKFLHLQKIIFFISFENLGKSEQMMYDIWHKKIVESFLENL